MQPAPEPNQVPKGLNENIVKDAATVRDEVMSPDCSSHRKKTGPIIQNALLDSTNDVESSPKEMGILTTLPMRGSGAASSQTGASDDNGDADARECRSPDNATILKRRRDDDESDLSAQDSESEYSLNDPPQPKRAKLRDSSDHDLKWLMVLGVRSADKILEDMERVKREVKELQSTITDAIDDYSNGLSWETRSMWRAALGYLEYDSSFRSWMRILESLKTGMELECEVERWESFMSL